MQKLPEKYEQQNDMFIDYLTVPVNNDNTVYCHRQIQSTSARIHAFASNKHETSTP